MNEDWVHSGVKKTVSDYGLFADIKKMQNRYLDRMKRSESKQKGIKMLEKLSNYCGALEGNFVDEES